MKKFLFVCAAMMATFASVTPSAQAITWCHDYSIYRASGLRVDPNRTSVTGLRNILSANGYRQVVGTNVQLREGDVVILGDSHSGFVNARGLIDHFIQVQGHVGVRYLPQHLPLPSSARLGGLFRNDTFAQMRGRLSNPPNGVQVWRKPQPAAPPVTAYYVVRVNVGNGILSVRSGAAINQGIALASFRHGGLSNARAPLTMLSGPHNSPQAATRAVAPLIASGTLRNAPLAAGYVGTVGGKMVTIDDMGSINFGLLRQLVGPTR